MIYRRIRIFCLKRSKIKEKEESYMKNIFKYLGAFAIAGVLGFSSVAAAEELKCEEGETIHTNYYMFLDVQSKAEYDRVIGSATTERPYTQWNGANKYNNIKGGKGISGDIGIKRNSESTNSGAPQSWTVEEYWKKYYTAWTKKDATTMVYTDGDVSYMMHDKWIAYGDNWSNPQDKAHSDNSRHAELISTLASNISNLGSSTLVRSGTSLPDSFSTVPGDLWTSQNQTFEWKIKRVFGQKDLLEGINLAGETVIYSPAVTFVQFCKKGSGGTTNPDPTPTEKKVDYDKNTTDKVDKMPSPQSQTFTKCINIDSSIPEREGYRFLGWSTNASATAADPKFNPNKEYCGESVILHAIWEKVEAGQFTITYNANGGKGEPAKQVGQVGAELTISSQKPTLSGNKFLGWSRDPQAKEPDHTYDPDQKYNGKYGDITLYAVWQPVTGVVSHLLTFGAITLAAIAGLVVTRKKNLFKQI